jgi:hypothetical protein
MADQFQNGHYQGLLCENPLVRLETVQTLNPATFLPTEEGSPDHDCKEVMDEVYSSRPDLMDVSSQIQSSNSSWMEAALSRADGKRPDSQSPLLMMS